jgi:segregation and condensation protein B
MDDLKKKVEALIFISDKPITIEDIQEQLDEEKVVIENITNDLVAEWNSLNHSFYIEKANNGFHFRTKENFKEMITEYINKKPYKLSKAALEVLGIIAKKQPVTKVEIDKLRGVDSIGTINVLIDRELIKISGEKDAPGRPFLYSTTELFLEIFSLNNINEVPDIEEFADADESLNPKNEV